MRLVLASLCVLLPALAAAQTSTVAVPNGSGGTSVYTVSVGTYGTSITPLFSTPGGDPCRRFYEVQDAEGNLVTIGPPAMARGRVLTYYVVRDHRVEYPIEPPVPMEVYYRLYPCVFPAEHKAQRAADKAQNEAAAAEMKRYKADLAAYEKAMKAYRKAQAKAAKDAAKAK